MLRSSLICAERASVAKPDNRCYINFKTALVPVYVRESGCMWLLACLISEDRRYRDVAVAQIEAMFDPQLWPNWRDAGHPDKQTCHLRHDQLSGDLEFDYDWLHAFLSETQRQMILEGLDRVATEPYFQSVHEEQPQLDWLNNIMIMIRGGLSIAGLALGDDHPQSGELIGLATKKMQQYLTVYGPEGSYNETISYAVSVMDLVRYFEALRSWVCCPPAVRSATANRREVTAARVLSLADVLYATTRSRGRAGRW